MKTKLAILGLCLAVVLPLPGQKKEDERLANSAKVMKEVLQGDKGLPTTVLNQAMCVLVFPSVKKVAVGIGGSYGRGVLVCRKEAGMNGTWGAPVMYGLDQESIGIQLGSTATDFVLVVMHDKGVDAILNGKTKLGADAAAAAGPTAAQATGYNAGDMKSSEPLAVADCNDGLTRCIYTPAECNVRVAPDVVKNDALNFRSIARLYPAKVIVGSPEFILDL